ncbi:MAG: VIT1/CCC1 transporter family protein [Synergistaceae bacterium]|nr:VIT1/CCC1 transporter family protein [Synergistaceae bacterium]
MNPDRELLPLLLEFQKTETTEHAIYSALADRVRGPNGDILRRIGEDEKRHAEIWGKHTGVTVTPSWWKVRLFLLLAAILGVTFAIKLLERGEEKAEKNYGRIAPHVPEANLILLEETEHEASLTALIDEERLQYMSSMILGLSDALVELTGALAGFTFALENGRIVALAGIITGVAAALSMSASEYLAQKTDDGEKKPLKAAFYTGTAYLFTVFVLVMPYFLFSNPFAALPVTILNGVAIIFFFTFYKSVVKDIPFRRNFLEMLFISLGVAGISFFIGFLARSLMGEAG